MLLNLKSFESLGTPGYFFELLTTLNHSGSNWNEDDIKNLFRNRSIDGRSILDGGINLALDIGVIKRDFNSNINIDSSIKSFMNSERQMCDKFVEYLFLALKNDDEFHEIFSSRNISYDVIYRSLQIDNSAFTFTYSNFKQLLIDFEIIQIHPTRQLKRYIFNSRYKKLFDFYILPEIKKRKIGIKELMKELEQRQIYGEEAELFVMEFEKKRLNNKIGIERISEYSVGEGYDIISFHSAESKLNDRFIEVKSFSSYPYFYWTRNEMDIARIKGNDYFLYLINRDELDKESYEPSMIQNPHLNVLKQNRWVKVVEKYKIELMI